MKSPSTPFPLTPLKQSSKKHVSYLIPQNTLVAATKATRLSLYSSPVTAPGKNIMKSSAPSDECEVAGVVSLKEASEKCYLCWATCSSGPKRLRRFSTGKFNVCVYEGRTSGIICKNACRLESEKCPRTLCTMRVLK